MNDLISIPRSSAEALLEVATQVLGTTDPSGPDCLERTEIALKNSIRKNLLEAVYQAEKAIYEADTKPLTSAQMSANAEKRRLSEDDCDYSQSKERWIAR